MKWFLLLYFAVLKCYCATGEEAATFYTFQLIIAINVRNDMRILIGKNAEKLDYCGKTSDIIIDITCFILM